MVDPKILTCAVTGNITTLQRTPHLPCSPAEIVAASLGAVRAGASVVHIHVRHPDGRPSMEMAHYREVVERLRAAEEDVVINLTTGPGGRFVPREDDPKIAAPGTNLLPPERRVEHVEALRPEICSLDFNTMYSGTSVVINTPRNLAIMAARIREAGVTPEIEAFDTGDLQLANQFLKDGHLESPPLFQLAIGIRYGAVATPETMLYMRSLLPPDARWAAFGIGRWEFPMVAQAWLLGGQCSRRPGGQHLPGEGRAGARQRRAGREGRAHRQDARREHRDAGRGARDARAPEGEAAAGRVTRGRPG